MRTKLVRVCPNCGREWRTVICPVCRVRTHQVRVEEPQKPKRRTRNG